MQTPLRLRRTHRIRLLHRRDNCDANWHICQYAVLVLRAHRFGCQEERWKGQGRHQIFLFQREWRIFIFYIYILIFFILHVYDFPCLYPLRIQLKEELIEKLKTHCDFSKLHQKLLMRGAK